VEKNENVAASVRDALQGEADDRVNQIDYYRDFADRVQQIRSSLRSLLQELRQQGSRIAAYGAAAKGSTLINYTGLGRDVLDFVVDRNTHKQGLFMPGQHIPILATDALVAQKPDYVLLLAWNFADEILEQQSAYRQMGGRFIIPVPHPQVV
jgi:hypothetical protein